MMQRKRIWFGFVSMMLSVAMLLPVSSLAFSQQQKEDIYRAKQYSFGIQKQAIDDLLNSNQYLYHLAVEESKYSYSILSLNSAEEAKQLMAVLLSLSAEKIKDQSLNEVYCDLVQSFCDEFKDFISTTTIPQQYMKKIQSVTNEVLQYYLSELSIDLSIQLESGSIDYDDIWDQISNRLSDEVPANTQYQVQKYFEAFKTSSEWLGEIKGILKIAKISGKVLDIASESMSLLAELESYKITDERLREMLHLIAYSTANESLRSAALTLRSKLVNSYEENLVNGIAEIVDSYLFDYIAGSLDDFLLSKFGLVGFMAQMGISCGNAVSNLWFNTGETKRLKKSIWCLNEVSEILVMLVNRALNNFNNSVDGTSDQAENAAVAIYYLKVLHALRKKGEETFYNMEMSMYNSAFVDMIQTLDFLDLTGYNNDETVIHAWYSETTRRLDDYEKTLFSFIDPDEYLESTPDSTDRLAENFSATVEDGIYTIRNQSYGKMMNVYAGGNADEVNVVTWRFDASVDQRFSIQHVGNGQYVLYAVCSDQGNGDFERCIDIYTGSTDTLPSSGDNVDIYRRDSSWNKCQLFYIVPSYENTVIFESCAVPGLVITAESPSQDDGNIIMSDYNGSDSQHWNLCDIKGVIGGDYYENDYENIGDYGEDIIGVAQTQLGYKEINVATGEPLYNGNGKWYTKYGDRFYNSGGAWCAFFVMWCAEEANVPTSRIPQAQSYGNCGTMETWFKNNGYWRGVDYNPLPGDIVFFDFENDGKDGKPDHVGIVVNAYEDGSVDTIEGNVCLNEMLQPADVGYYQVGFVHRTKDVIMGYAAALGNEAGYANSMAWKTVDAYMLPDQNSETVWYVENEDRCIILCQDEEYYLLMYPFLNTEKYVVAYVPTNSILRFMEPYYEIPLAEDFYDINKQVVLKSDTKAYHNPSIGPLIGSSSADVRVRATWGEGSVVTVLFEYHSFYFVTTETQSGFVRKSDIDLNYVPQEKPDNNETPSIPENPDPEEPNQPAEPVEPAPEPEEILLGDVDGNGIIEELDAHLILQHEAKLLELMESELKRADADGNGVVNVADAAKIFMMI